MKKVYEPELVASFVPEEPVPGEHRAQYLRPGELIALQRVFPVAYQPVGTLEWHGVQNPIGCDAIKAEALCLEAAKRTGGVVMPALYFSSDAYRDCGKGYGLGMDPEAGFLLPGSFYQMPNDLFIALLENACRNYLARGFELVVLVSGHNPAIQQNLMDEVCHRFMSSEGDQHVVATMEYTVIDQGHPARWGDHAGYYETSMMLYHTDRVNMDRERAPNPDLAVHSERSWTVATRDYGEVRMTLQVQGMVRFVRHAWDELNRIKSGV